MIPFFIFKNVVCLGSGLFGSNASKSSSLFGAAQPTSSLFGQTSTASGFTGEIANEMDEDRTTDMGRNVACTDDRAR